MAMRIIFTCMVIVGLCLLAYPLMPVFNGIDDERSQILAAADNSNYPLSAPPRLEGNSTTSFAETQNGAALSDIEPAAGADSTSQGPDNGFSGGFSNEAPAALQDNTATPSNP